MGDPAGRTRELVGEIERAQRLGLTLPAHWYTSQEVHDLEQELVMRRTWQLVHDVALPQEPGDFAATTVAGVPVLLVRDDKGELRGFLNICRHRCHEVAQGTGNTKRLQCAYHGWTYGLDGDLKGVPRGNREGFDPTPWSLLPVGVGQWGPLVFVNVAAGQQATTFVDDHADFIRVAADRGLSLDGMTRRRRISHACACNWKVLMENSCECYHCATTHPGFRSEHHVSPDHYVLEPYEGFTYHRAPLRSGVRDTPGKEERRDWEMYQLWPNLLMMTGSVPGMNHVLLKLGDSPTTTSFVVDLWATDEVDDATVNAEVEGWEVVLGEDKRVIESIQRGLDSGLVPEGPLLVESERIIVEFQRRLLGWFSAEDAPKTPQSVAS